MVQYQSGAIKDDQNQGWHLVKHVLARTAEQDRARLRVFAINHKREVLVADFLHLPNKISFSSIGLCNW